MPALEVLAAGAAGTDGGDGPLPRRNRLAVGDLGRWRDDDARTGDLRTPTEIEVFTQCGDQRVEAAQRGEEVTTHEGDATGRDEDVTLEVLLAVIDLARLDSFVHDPESVAGLTDVQQDHGVVVGDDLRRDDASVRSKRRLDHHLHRVVFEAYVVVAEEEERGSLDHQ